MARNITNNFPLRGGKGTLYEGGLRVPFIIRWPGNIPPGRTSDQPAAHVDLFPTFLEVAGKKTMPRHKLDGISIVKLWKDPDLKLDRDPIYLHFPGYLEAGKGGWRTTPACMMRAGDFTLLEFFEDNRLELYNVKEDLSQKRNLAKEMPQKTRELHQKMTDWRKDVKAAMPTMKKTASLEKVRRAGEFASWVENNSAARPPGSISGAESVGRLAADGPSKLHLR
jgi:arylsulfatase A-like enzyme